MKKTIQEITCITTVVLIFFLFSFSLHVFNLFVPSPDIDPTFSKYHDSFIKESENRSIIPFIRYMKPSITFGIKDDFDISHHYAHCQIYFGLKPKIVVNPESWKSLTETQKEMVIFHELGHCLLFKGHASNSDYSKKPSSIMVKSVPQQRFYSKNKDFYLDELFTYNLKHIYQTIQTLLIGES